MEDPGELSPRWIGLMFLQCMSSAGARKARRSSQVPRILEFEWRCGILCKRQNRCLWPPIMLNPKPLNPKPSGPKR